MDDVDTYYLSVSWCADLCDRIRMRSAATSVSVHQVPLAFLANDLRNFVLILPTIGLFIG